MKKILLLLCTLLASVGLWAERTVEEYQLGAALTSTEQISATQAYVVRVSGVSYITETATTYEAPNAQNQITDNALFYFEKNSDDNTYYINCKGTQNYWGTFTSNVKGEWAPSTGYPAKGFELTFDGTHVQMKSGDYYVNRSSGIMHGWASAINYLEIYPATAVTTTYLSFLEELSNQKAYVITNARGTWNTSDGSTLTTTKTLDKNAESQQFAIINYKDQYYVYSVSAKAFLNADKSFGDPAAIQITELDDMDYPNFFKFDDTHNVNVQGNGNVVIDGWSTVDPGNSNRIIEAADFDPTEALNALYEFPYQKYLVKNVESGMYWGAANDWGTRASLVPNAEYLKLVPQADGTYQIESQVNNGGTSYYFNGDYMDNGSPVALDIAKVENGYTIANGTNYFGWDGSSTILGKNLSADSENAVWTIVSLDDAKEALADATSAAPADATFLIEDHNFGRNNRYQNKWTGTGLKKGGDNSNLNTESYMAAFGLSQTLTDIPNGIYKLEAQAAVTYHDNRTVKEYDGEGAPVIYANEESSDFNIMETADQLSSQSKMSTQFSAGLYQVEPVFVEVTDGTLTVGAKCERTDIWAVWDNFVLTFYGTDATIDQLKNSALFDKVAELREKVQEILDSEELEVEEVTTQLNDALAATTDVTTVEQAESAIETLQEAYDLGKAYVDVKDVLEARKTLTENNNVCTQEAYEAYYTQWYDKYVAATLTAEEANALENPFTLTGWQHNASTQSDDYLLSTWSIGGEKAKDYEKSLYINTWSVEGESDGTDFKVPFFEYWTGDDNSLGATTISAQLENLPAGKYDITTWVRVRAKNGTTAADATGVTLKVTGGEDVDVTEGEAVNQFNIAEYTAQAVVGEDGVLEISFDVADGNNVSWLSFQNVKYEKVENEVSEEPIGWWKFDNAEDLLAPEPETTATLQPSTQAENKTIVLEKTLENANITVAEGPTADNGAITVPVRSSLYMLANTSSEIGSTYSIMYDVKVADPAHYTSLLQSDLTNVSDGDLFISGGQVGVRTAGLNYHGAINADEWYRIMFVVEDNMATVYVNGEEVGKSTEASDRWQLAEGAIFFCDDDGEETEIQTAEIRLWNRALSAEEVAELGAIEGTDQSVPTPLGVWTFDDEDDLMAGDCTATLTSTTHTNGSVTTHEDPAEANITPVDGPASDNGAIKLPVGSSLLMASNLDVDNIGTYTVMWDVKADDVSGYSPLLQNGLTNGKDGSFFIKDGQVGLGGNLGYHGSLPAEEWHRVVLVVQPNAATVYIDGEEVGACTAATRPYSEHWLLSTGALFFADNDGEEKEIQTAEIRFWDKALSAAQVAELGTIEIEELPTDPYELALAMVKDGNYRIFTEVEGTKYYVNYEGKLVAETDDAGIFAFSKVTGGAYREYGYKIDSGSKRFTNPSLSNNVANLNPGAFATTTGNRSDWEAQVLFMKDGKLAIRSCNVVDGTSSWNDAGRTYWTYKVEDDEVPTPCYTYEAETYLWQLEGPLTTINVSYQLCEADGETTVGNPVVQKQEANSNVNIPTAMTGLSYNGGWAPYALYDYTAEGTIGDEDCTIKVIRTFAEGLVHALSDLSNEKAYTIRCDRGALLTDGTTIASTSHATLHEAEPAEFAVISYEDNYYIYSVADKKFVLNNGSLSDMPTNGVYDAIQMAPTADPYFLFTFKINDETTYGLNTNGTGALNGCVINSWVTPDAGDQYYMIESSEFDAAEALAALDAYFHPSFYVTYVVKDAEGNTVFTSEPVPAAAGAHITTLPADYQRPFCTYDEVDVTIEEEETTVEFTYTWNGPVELAESFGSIKWYNMYINRGEDNHWYLSLDDVTPKFVQNPSEEELAAEEYQWGFTGNPYDGLKMYNNSKTEIWTLTSNNGVAMAEGEFAWNLLAENAEGILIGNTTDNGYLNQWGGATGTGIGLWGSTTDMGSTFYAEEVEVEPLPEGTYSGVIKQILSHPQTGKQGEATDKQTVTITDGEEEGTVNITYSGFTMPVTGAVLPEFTVEGVEKTTNDDGTISYELPVWAPQTITIDRGTGSVTYKVALTGTQESEDATPVLKLTLDNSVVDEIWFAADLETINNAIEEEEATGIRGTRGIADGATIFDISGRKVAKIQTGGIYIVNGKKVSVK